MELVKASIVSLLMNLERKKEITSFNFVNRPKVIFLTVKTKASFSPSEDTTVSLDNVVVNFALVSKNQALPETFKT